MKIKWFLIGFVVLVLSFMSGVLLKGCEQAHGSEMSPEFRTLVCEFNEAGKKLTQAGVRVSNIEMAFLEKIEELKSVYLSLEKKELCRDEINILFNNLMLGGSQLKSAVVKMKNVLNKVIVFKENSEEKEIKEKIVALGNDMISKACAKIEKLEKYDAEFTPFDHYPT